MALSWDDYFVSLAYLVKEKSKDPSSKIGAVIVGPDREILTTGFNGFPRGIDETNPKRWERPEKYQRVVHAEMNALLNAARIGVSLKGATLYLSGFGPPTVPCIECAKAVIQAGIVRVVGAPYKDIPPTWIDDLGFARSMLIEAGVVLDENLLNWSA